MRWLIIVAALRGFAFACDDVRQDELDCEEAVAQLQHCCSALDTRSISCEYRAPGCETDAEDPDIGLAESRCIRERSCEYLVKSGVCERAAHLEDTQLSGTEALCL